MKYTHILWDWNGTLLDDVDISIECVNIMLKKLNLPVTNLEEYYQMMDVPMKKYYNNLFKGKKVPYEFCTENFQINYPKLFEKARLMPGAIEILDFFKTNKTEQYIVSSFEQNRLIKYVNHFNISKYFVQISGDKDINVGSKSQRAIELTKKIDKSNILYIGDSKADYITANDVGCDCILICKGHQPKDILKTFGCPVVENLSEIANLCI